MRQQTALGVFLLVTAGCDPGFSYVLPEAKPVRADGVRYVVRAAEEVEARFYASVFIKNGHSEIQVINRSDRPISFTPVPSVITDANGKAIEVRGCAFSTGESQSVLRVVVDAGAAPSILSKNQMATVRCGFEVEFAGRSYSRAFEKVTFIQAGFAENGREMPVRAAMVWDY